MAFSRRAEVVLEELRDLLAEYTRERMHKTDLVILSIDTIAEKIDELNEKMEMIRTHLEQIAKALQKK